MENKKHDIDEIEELEKLRSKCKFLEYQYDKKTLEFDEINSIVKGLTLDIKIMEDKCMKLELQFKELHDNKEEILDELNSIEYLINLNNLESNESNESKNGISLTSEDENITLELKYSYLSNLITKIKNYID